MTRYSNDYTRNELKILWYLKRKGPLVNNGPYSPAAERDIKRSILHRLAIHCDIRKNTVAYILKSLEDRSIILRTYNRKKAIDFSDKTSGYNPIVRVELVDPTMWLPELPPPMPLGVVMAKETEEMYERSAEAPTLERTITALLDRNEELQNQINKLCLVVEAQEMENKELKDKVEKLSKPAKTHISNGLTDRVKSALTPEQWEKLRHG